MGKQKICREFEIKVREELWSVVRGLLLSTASLFPLVRRVGRAGFAPPDRYLVNDACSPGDYPENRLGQIDSDVNPFFARVCVVQ